jgi:hypothetical protein
MVREGQEGELNTMLTQSRILLPVMGLLFQSRESLQRTGDNAFFTAQVISLFVISRILLGIFELVLLKLFKMNKYAGIVISAVLAFLLYLAPNLLLSGVSSIPGAGPEIAAREAAATQTNIMFMGIWLAVWVVIDLIVASFLGRKTKPQS